MAGLTTIPTTPIFPTVLIGNVGGLFMFSRSRRRASTALAAVAALSALTLAACGSSSGGGASTSGSGSPSASSDITTLRVGFFPNLTHAPAYVALQEGYFKDDLGALGRQGRPDAVQRRSRRRDRAVRQLDRHRLRRPEPHRERLDAVQGRGDQGDLRRRLRWGIVRRGQGHHQRQGPRGQDRGQPAAGQHPGRRAEVLAEPERRAGRRPMGRAR